MELLTWGANSYGQLGLGYKSEQVLLPTVVDFNAELIQLVAAGGGHTIILTTSGSLYACGWNTKGQLGLDTTADFLFFTEITSLKGIQISQVACGWDFTIVISNLGKLFAWGSNAFSQLSLPKDIKCVSKPTFIQTDWVPKYVACGLRHTAVISTAGDVFVCGSGTKGQLGLGYIQQNTLFTKVPQITDAVSVSCGQHHTVVLTRNGILVWGNNKYGQLGYEPKSYSQSLVPIELELTEIPLEIHTGWTHTVILTECHHIFNFGRNSYGQLGKKRNQCWIPEKLDLTKIIKVSVGSEHNLAVSFNNKLLCWGWNEHGNCGTGNTEDVLVPTALNVEGSIQHIATGSGQSFAIIYK